MNIMNLNVLKRKGFFDRWNFTQNFIFLTLIIKTIHYCYASEPLCLKVFISLEMSRVNAI